MKQIYIIDTCVLLHDPNCISRFGNADVYIPLAVIADLDEQKTKSGSLGWAAREVFRILEQYNLEELAAPKGAKIFGSNGKLFIYNPDRPTAVDSPNITRVNSDNAIVLAAMGLKRSYPKRKVIIVTKDMALRVIAHAWGCDAINYQNDLITEKNAYKGLREIELDESDNWDALWKNTDILFDDLSEKTRNKIKDVSINEFIILKSGDSCIPTQSIEKNKLHILKDKNGNTPKEFMGIKSKNIEQKCAIEALSNNKYSLVALSGSAGTGKTLLSLAVSLQKVYDGEFERLIIMKPIIPVGGRDIGALPGDKWEKLYEWLGPMRDNIEQLTDKTKPMLTLEDLVKDRIVEVEAMSYIQGRSIPRSIILVDEAENISPREARMVVERCGKDSKIILLGDLSQVENPYLDSRSCGLAHAIQGCKDKLNCISVPLTKVERSELAAMASEIFNQPEAHK